MHQNFPIKFSQFLTGRQRCVGSGIVVMTPFLFLINPDRFLLIA